jgi:hypothetical protein
LTASCCHLSGMIKLTIAINVLRERGRVQLENGLDESWKYGARLSPRDAQGKNG